MTINPARAGEWKQLEGGESWQWWYENEDGTYPVNDWHYMESSGAMLTNVSLAGSYDSNTVLPDLYNAIYSTATYRFNGFKLSIREITYWYASPFYQIFLILQLFSLFQLFLILNINIAVYW